ncbi:hypothetical protein IJM86_04190 [bacterium]|nr:hypothetical protein [bacterium]
MNTILNFQLSKEIKESKEALEKATAPLAHAFDISYHLLKDKKYPLSDKEIQEHFSHNKKEYENIEKKIKEKDNTVQEENSKEHPDEKRIGQLLQEIETLKRNYKILQLPQ